jgi:hypothetical protein
MKNFPEAVPQSTPYWENFKLLLSDLEETFRYVQPLEKHLSVYSLRYYELLLRASTEFESACKEKLIELKLSSVDPKQFNIKEYHKLAEPLELSQYSVIYNFQPLYGVEPFEEWKASHALSWYQEYNAVKHNRNSEFEKANLANVLSSIAAVFIVITKARLCPMDESKWLRSYGMVSIVDDRNLIMRKSLKQRKPELDLPEKG